MSLVPLLPLFHRLNARYFDGLLSNGLQSLVSVRWSDGRLTSTAGFYRRGNGVAGCKGREIVLSRPILSKLPTSAIESTLCHEMIHAWIDLVLKIREVHGPNFRSKMIAINSAQNDFQVSVRHTFPTLKKDPKWWAICPSCQIKIPYQRLVRGAACRNCCQIHNGGFWDKSLLLAFEPAVRE